MADYWCIKDGLQRVDVKPIQQNRTKRLGQITVYRDSFGVTYSGKYIRTWEDLTPDQKKKAYRNLYQSKRDAALWDMAKDPDLESQYPAWIAQLKRDRDDAITRIENGEQVPPPPHIWE